MKEEKQILVFGDSFQISRRYCANNQLNSKCIITCVEHLFGLKHGSVVITLVGDVYNNDMLRPIMKEAKIKDFSIIRRMEDCELDMNHILKHIRRHRR